MAEIAKTGTPSLASLLPSGADVLAGLLAGEAIGAVDACRVAADGKVYRSSGAAANANAKVRGFAAKATAIGESVTLYKNVRVRYGTGLTPGADLFLSGTVAGGLADAASTGGAGAIGYVVDSERVHLEASRY